jgi:hypothetical protein
MAAINKWQTIFFLLLSFLANLLVAAVPFTGHADELADGDNVGIFPQHYTERCSLPKDSRTTPVTHSESFSRLLYLLFFGLLFQHLLEW